MSLRNALLGPIVLGIVLMGVFWARGWGRSGPWEADADAALPDVTLAEGVADLGDLQITLSVAPRPPVAFQKSRFRVRVASNGTSMALEGGRISFEMKMPMGDHRYALVPSGDGWQEAEVVLPFCQSGNPRWYASVEGTVAGQPRTARFRLYLTRPGSAPASSSTRWPAP